MGEQEQDKPEEPSEITALKAEVSSLKSQLIQVQRAYLLQQRELNVLQMEKLDSMEV